MILLRYINITVTLVSSNGVGQRPVRNSGWKAEDHRLPMSNFRTIDRQTGFLLPPSVDEWLPERHLARFVVEVIDGLDLRAMVGAYRGAGSAAPAATAIKAAEFRP